MRVAFFGTPAYAAISLKALLECRRHDVVGVVCRADAAGGRGKKLRPCSVKSMALEANLPVLDPAKPTGEPFTEAFSSWQAEVGLVVAYGRMLPTQLLRIPLYGFINAHGSLLPKLRGAAPIERAILAGLSTTGVSTMQVNAEMDEGDVLAKRTIAIGKETNAGQLRQEMAELSAELLLDTLAELEAGALVAKPQAEAEATYAPPLKRSESSINWDLKSIEVDRQIRAFAPKPGAFTFIGASRLKVLKARIDNQSQHHAAPGTVLEATAQGPTIACAAGSVLLQIVQGEGKKPTDACSFVRGSSVLTPGNVLSAGA